MFGGGCPAHCISIGQFADHVVFVPQSPRVAPRQLPPVATVTYIAVDLVDLPEDIGAGTGIGTRHVDAIG